MRPPLQFRLVLCSLGLIAAGGCGDSAGIHTDAAYAGKGQYRGLGARYDYMGDARRIDKASKEVQAIPADVQRFVEEQLDDGLGRRGYARAAEGAAVDFSISYRVTRQTRAKAIEQYPFSEEFEEGALVLDVVEPGTSKVIWRGVARGKLSEDMSPEERKKRVTAALHQLLEKFPTRDGSTPQRKPNGE